MALRSCPPMRKIPNGKIRAMPLVHDKASIGTWSMIAWDPRRFLALRRAIRGRTRRSRTTRLPGPRRRGARATAAAPEIAGRLIAFQGPLRVRRVDFVMSAICLVYPQQQTSPGPVGTSHWARLGRRRITNNAVGQVLKPGCSQAPIAGASVPLSYIYTPKRLSQRHRSSGLVRRRARPHQGGQGQPILISSCLELGHHRFRQPCHLRTHHPNTCAE